MSGWIRRVAERETQHSVLWRRPLRSAAPAVGRPPFHGLRAFICAQADPASRLTSLTQVGLRRGDERAMTPRDRRQAHSCSSHTRSLAALGFREQERIASKVSTDGTSLTSHSAPQNQQNAMNWAVALDECCTRGHYPRRLRHWCDDRSKPERQTHCE